MGEYLHNLTITFGWVWLIVAFFGFIAYVNYSEETNDWKILGWVTFWGGSFILDAVALYTYYS